MQHRDLLTLDCDAPLQDNVRIMIHHCVCKSESNSPTRVFEAVTCHRNRTIPFEQELSAKEVDDNLTDDDAYLTLWHVCTKAKYSLMFCFSFFYTYYFHVLFSWVVEHQRERRKGDDLCDGMSRLYIDDYSMDIQTLRMTSARPWPNSRLASSFSCRSSRHLCA